MNQSEGPLQQQAALIMTGGGARAAYQVGVMRALSELFAPGIPCPFPIICGTSAGAVNAAVLATDAHDFRHGVRRLMTVWKNIHVDRVYRADPVGALSNSARWIGSVITGGTLARKPISLLDNTPLREMLERDLDFAAIERHIAAGYLSAFSITCSGYSSGESVTFYQGRSEVESWRRARRIGFAMPIRRARSQFSSPARAW